MGIIVKPHRVSIEFRLISGEHRQRFAVAREVSLRASNRERAGVFKSAMIEAGTLLERQIETGTISTIVHCNSCHSTHLDRFSLLPDWSIEGS